VIDYSDLAEKYKDLYETDEVRREGDRLQRQVNELSNTIQRIQAPNMRVCFLFYPLKNTSKQNYFSFSGYAEARFSSRKAARDS
jgi:hypothetical protein